MSAADPVFITGASGFIGGKLAERLLAAGRRVRALARRPLPALEKLGAEIVSGDLHDLPALTRGCAGAGTVFHAAGRVGVWGPAKEFFRVNFGGTQNIITACRAAGVARLVYTSSPSAVYNGGDLSGVDESAPLCTDAPSGYPTSKAAAERAVAQAHGRELSTVSLRPHLVWGPGDRNVVPRMLAEHALLNGAKVTPPRAAVDAGISSPADLTASAGTCHALDDNCGTPREAGGRAYFITNGEPVVLWDWINELLRGAGLPEITKHVSLRSAYRAGGLLEAVWRILPLKGEPPMTRFIAKELATDHWFNITAARRDLGYAPRVTMAAGTQELIAHYRAGKEF